MADMNSFMKKVGVATEKAIDKGAYVADIALTKTKIKTEEMRLNKQYAALGRLYFENMNSEDVLDDFEPVIDKINAIIDKIGKLEAEYRGKVTKNSQKEQGEKRESGKRNSCGCDLDNCDI